ncbi:VOC family protein [Ramlibacter sp. PS3R-8]|uniref:VOC family protein n=1 Tax=Ramlibacter sp. PS3R-8 TaxID=3133437 RepID=UPI0030A643C6
MLASQIAYVALASKDPAATALVLQQHLKLPRTDLLDAAGTAVPVFALGRSALAVFPLGHPMIDGDATPGVHHIALGVDDVERAVRHAAEVGIAAAGANPGLGGRKTVALDRQATVGVRVRLTDGLDLPRQAGEVIERIDHLGVASADVAEDERVFSRKLGFEVESRQTDMEVSMAVESFTSDKYGVVYHNRPPQPVGGLRVAFITVGDCELEFLANFDPDDGAQVEHGRSGSTKQDQGAITRFVQSRGRGLHHMALKAKDIDATLAGMARAGLPMIDTRGRPGSRRARIGFAHPHATGGILMHLVQRDA